MNEEKNTQHVELEFNSDELIAITHTTNPLEPLITLKFRCPESLRQALSRAGYVSKIRKNERRGNRKAFENLNGYLSPTNLIPSNNPNQLGIYFSEFLDLVVRYRLDSRNITDEEVQDRDLIARIANTEFTSLDLMKVAPKVAKDHSLDLPEVFTNARTMGRLLSCWINSEEHGPTFPVETQDGNPKTYKKINENTETVGIPAEAQTERSPSLHTQGD